MARNPLLAAASKMLRRSQMRRDISMACDSADECFTKIISVNSGDNVDKAIKLAEEHGLEATWYRECKIGVTGPRDKVLQFQELIRKSFFGEELPPTEGVHVVTDLIQMSHDLVPGSKIQRQVALAIQDLESLHPVSQQRMRQYKSLRDQLK